MIRPLRARRLYGEGGRSAITTLTLFGGFASTACWPLSAFLDAHLGRRGVCLVYAGFQLVVALPVYLFVLPREPRRPAPLSGSPNSPSRASRHPTVLGEAVFSGGCNHYADLGDLNHDVGSSADDLEARGLTLAAAVGSAHSSDPLR